MQLRFDAAASPALDERVRERLMRLAGTRLTSDGVIVIDARRHRTQGANREDARERLAALIREAATPPRWRRKTRPTAASKARRVETKKRRAQTKGGRGKVAPDE